MHPEKVVCEVITHDQEKAEPNLSCETEPSSHGICSNRLGTELSELELLAKRSARTELLGEI